MSKTKSFQIGAAILTLALVLSLPFTSFAQTEAEESGDAIEDAAQDPALVSPEQEKKDVMADLELEKVKLATEQARAEAAKAQAEAEKAKLEAEKSRLELEKSRAKTEKAIVEADKVEIADEDQPGYHTHDGLFLRLSAGLGYSGFSSDGQESKDISSHNTIGSTGSFSIGGSVTENIALHADLWGVSSHMNHDSKSFNTGGLGLGMTYYFMPYNIYLTGSIGPAAIVYDDGNYENYDWEDHKAAYGLWTSVSVGKEWWVSSNWGLGLALKGNYAYARNENVSYHQGGLMAMFSATFN